MESNGLMLHSYNFEVEHCCAILGCSTEQVQLGRGLKSLCSEATLPIAYSEFPGSVVATHLLVSSIFWWDQQYPGRCSDFVQFWTMVHSNLTISPRICRPQPGSGLRLPLAWWCCFPFLKFPAFQCHFLNLSLVFLLPQTHHSLLVILNL